MPRFTNALLISDDFTALLRRISEHRIPISIGLKLLRLYKRLEEERGLVLESRNTLIRHYGADDGEGRIVIPQDDAETLANFHRELNQLLSLECDVSVEEKLKVPLPLLDKEGREFSLNMAELAMLSELLEFAEAESHAV